MSSFLRPLGVFEIKKHLQPKRAAMQILTKNIWRKRIIDLKPNGRDIPLTEENKQEYIHLITQQKLTVAIKDQIHKDFSSIQRLPSAHTWCAMWSDTWESKQAVELLETWVDIEVEIIGTVPDKCTIFKSNLLPLKMTFKTIDFSNDIDLRFDTQSTYMAIATLIDSLETTISQVKQQIGDSKAINFFMGRQYGDNEGLRHTINVQCSKDDTDGLEQRQIYTLLTLFSSIKTSGNDFMTGVSDLCETLLEPFKGEFREYNRCMFNEGLILNEEVDKAI
ncbi:hypothetical protein CONCODRAFT_3930 [Conidiobolus coronatus NRRL 28638]|uniref:HECT-type E3 ubiquitin transferase n=1 Tax=Conidiobolus coronatus (strain ATCC 28846 / CBS 209.66 / NRRL 28638) TaxID=796925 RepID=A0A137PE43_CONC2|nr:hypothetical protein CONCODRAFT_3930 [Conidiobolus coronatus NRRL 28638]|eukprot:KXN73250.1 hypothetical protein CONCODRAFT_3930 [Conidiobolus coronatus NRRL 28638]